MNKHYLVIADDFTGANDTGVQMSKRDIKTEVILFPTTEPVTSSLVLDTESRVLTAEEAYAKVKKQTETLLSANNFKLVYKKIDSTLRGNIVAELKAVCDVYQPERIIFAPAFPKIKRSTVNGTHLLDGVPLMETELAHDPLNPIKTDNLQKLLAAGFEESMSHYTTDQLKPDLTLSADFVHIFDITEDQHLTVLAEVLLQLPGKTLYVGSAGLAEMLFQQLEPAKPALAVVGSISQVSLEQMSYAEKQGTAVINVALTDLAKEEVVSTYRDKVKAVLKTGQDAILTVTRTKKDYDETLALFEKAASVDKKEVSELVRNILAKITKEVLQTTPISGLFLTGGDTAIEVIDLLGATGNLIEKELFTGIVASELVGGNFSGLKIVTKAGAFGNDESLYESLNKLK